MIKLYQANINNNRKDLYFLVQDKKAYIGYRLVSSFYQSLWTNSVIVETAPTGYFSDRYLTNWTVFKFNTFDMRLTKYWPNHPQTMYDHLRSN